MHRGGRRARAAHEEPLRRQQLALEPAEFELVREDVVTVTEEPRRAEVEIIWEGGARIELTMPLVRRGPERHRTSGVRKGSLRSST
jgi:hypothetical protein